VFDRPEVRHRTLELIATGMKQSDVVAELGTTERSLSRAMARPTHDGLKFGAAINVAKELLARGTPEAQAALSQLVDAWRPPEPEPPPVVEPEPEPLPEPEPVELPLPELPVPDPVEPPITPPEPVANPSPVTTGEDATFEREAQGGAITKPDRVVVEAEVVSRPRKPGRPPKVDPNAVPEPPPPYPATREELREKLFEFYWAKMHDKTEHPRMRVVCTQALHSEAFEPRFSRAHPSPAAEAIEQQAARERGRDPGVPASVWQEARRNFLGPAPDEAETDKGGDVVEFEQATPS
jgi:hypothetical protein